MSKEHYDAARANAAVIRKDWMGVLKLTGPERKTWLQGMVTNEVEKLGAGQGCYAAHLNAQGKVVAQMIVLVAEEEVWLLVEREAAGKLSGVFDKLIIMEDVQVSDSSQDYVVLEVIGPETSAVVQRWTGQTLPEGAPYAHQSSAQGRIVSSDLGIDVIVPRANAEQALSAIIDAGAIEIEMETWNVLRSEAGLPLYGVDIDETTTLPELGQRGISYDKGCYIGQEVVARIKYIGHVNRRFVGFVCKGNAVPELRSAVQVKGKDVGYVTTAVFSPRINRAIALGFVNRVAAEPGTEVLIAGESGPIIAVVSAFPLLNRFAD